MAKKGLHLNLNEKERLFLLLNLDLYLQLTPNQLSVYCTAYRRLYRKSQNHINCKYGWETFASQRNNHR